ncbi:MAG: 50S ribosomal protein L22 [Dehalococcoidales bacterium]|nr:50S ribosomal protein L22 [Dehalococcoidales bacterium]
MQVRAFAKNTGIPARKIRPLIDMVRGKTVDEALILLRFTPSPNARVVAKTVKSAAANAENNYQVTPSDLKIISIYADEAPRLRRFYPRARGRMSPVQKNSSHITVIVADEEA